MKSCFFIHFSSFQTRGIESIINEIKKENPDKIICLCLTEFAYEYIFHSFFTAIDEYLLSTGKKITIIVPFKDVTFNNPNIIEEESYGYYHCGVGTVENCIMNNIFFTWNDHIRLFTSYNNNNKPHRNLLIDLLAKNDLLSDGIVSFNPPTNQYNFKYYDGSILKDEQNFVLNATHEFTAGLLPKNYLNGFIDVVSESTWEEGHFFVTEKTAKPIGTLKPFLIVGPSKFHKHLYDKYGIEYYDELFDYSFDDEIDMELRYEGVIRNIMKFKNMPKHEWISHYDSIKNKLICNRDKFIALGCDEEKYIPESLKFLLKANSITLLGDVAAATEIAGIPRRLKERYGK